MRSSLATISACTVGETDEQMDAELPLEGVRRGRGRKSVISVDKHAQQGMRVTDAHRSRLAQDSA